MPIVNKLWCHCLRAKAKNMLHKITTLSTILELRKFDVSALSQRSGVKPGSVQSILNRLPTEWFSREKVATRARGGQPVHYTLSEVGRATITNELGKLPSHKSIPMLIGSSTIPWGLTLAIKELERFQETAIEKRLSSLKKIENDLRWAESELNDSEITEATHEIRGQLQKAKDTFAKFFSEVDSAEPHSIANQEIATLMPDNNKAGRANIEETLLASSEKIPFETYQVKELVSTDRQRGQVQVIFSSVSKNGSTKQLAATARAMLCSSLNTAQKLGYGTLLDVSFCEAPLRFDELQKWITHDSLPSKRLLSQRSDFFLCVDSAKETRQLVTTLNRLSTLKGGRATHVIVLDNAESEEIAGLVASAHFVYQPHATTNTNWVNEAIIDQWNPMKEIVDFEETNLQLHHRD